MSLLTTQRIISNGLAQLQFEDVWPSVRGCPPDESVLRGLSAPKLLELRQLVRQVVLDQGRKIVIFSQWRRMLHLAHWAVTRPAGRAGAPRRVLHRRREARSGGPRTSSSSTTTPSSASSSPATPAVSG